MLPMNINTPTYTLSATTSSSAVTLTPQDENQTNLQIYNAGTVPVFLVSGSGTAPTAVFPTSATAPLDGTVIAPGAIYIMTKNTSHEFISGITASGTASVYIKSGCGI